MADYTPTHFGTLIADTTWAHQVANAVILQAPLLVYVAHPQHMLENPSVDVLKAIPSTWDETVVLPVSEIRQVAAFARRSGNTWFLAITNGATARNVHINLSFLRAPQPQAERPVPYLADTPDHLAPPQGGRPAPYLATLLRDTGDPAALKVEHVTLSASDSLSIDLRSGGGFVAMFKR
jgi:alpha-glucosidase